MDPVTIVVSALAAGASAGLKDTVANAIKDAYASLKSVILRRYSAASTAGIEKKPDSKAQRDALIETLRDAGAGKDEELLAAAKALLAAVEEHDPEAARAVGVKLTRIDAGTLDIQDVDAGIGATGLDASDVKVHGDMRVSGIRAGSQKPEHP